MSEKKAEKKLSVRTFADDFAAAKARLPEAEQDTTQTEQLTTPTKDGVAANDETYLDVETPQSAPQEQLQDIDTAVEGGQIVREKRRRDFKLFPAMGKALQSWFGAKKKEIAARRAQPTVADPSQRSDTITSATSNSALPNADDYDSVAERVAAQEKVTAEDTLKVRERQETTPQWSSSLHKEEVEPTPQPPQPAPESEPQPQVVPEPTPTPEPEPQATPQPAQVAAPKPESVTDQPAYQYRPTPVDAASDWRTWLVLGSVAVSAIVLGVTVSVWVYQYFSAPERVLAPEVPSAITVDRRQPLSLNEGNNLMTQMRQRMSETGNGVVQIYPTVSLTEGQTQPASVDEILRTIVLSADGSFQRNITGITFISYNQTGVGIILEIESFDTALGGMYSWEQNLVDDFMPLLGTGPATNFIDTTNSNRDIRVAKRGDGSELLYTFIDRNTLLIATDRSLISEVVNRRKE